MIRRLTLILLPAILLLGAGTSGALRPVIASELSGPPGITQERLEFETDVHLRLAPYARELPNYAGIYLDNSQGGRAVVLLTSRDPVAEEAMRGMVAETPGIEIRQVKHSYAMLKAAVDRTWDVWPDMGRDEELVAVGLDVMNNEIDVYLSSVDLEVLEAVEADLSAAIGVPVHVDTGEPMTTTACTNRENCASPMKAGILIHKGSTTGSKCTMAFHVRYGVDEQFITAGHCGDGGYGGPADKWYHQGYPSFIHWEQANGLRDNGFDVQRVQLLDSQASYYVYGVSQIVGNWAWPLVGSTAGVSAGASNRVVWNIVRDDYLTVGLEIYSNVVVARMDSAPGGKDGDSGSPVFHVINQRVYAIGVGSGTVVLGGVTYDVFGRFGDANAAWGVSPVSG